MIVEIVPPVHGNDRDVEDEAYEVLWSCGVLLLQMERMGGTVVSVTDKYMNDLRLCSAGVYAFEVHSICTTSSSITAVATAVAVSAQPVIYNPRPKAQAQIATDGQCRCRCRSAGPFVVHCGALSTSIAQ
jgi:hypothetical protein